MFYSEVILARKGPLGKIWLAAHFDKKLTRNQIFTTDISSSVESILNPTSPLALRVSGHLMLGIVRIYSRKVNYLMTECKEAMWKINLAFRPGTFDIDPNFASTLNINDARHFGNIDLENELPGLENTEFPHVLLPEQENFRTDAQHADVSFYGHTLQDYSLSAESPQVRLGSRASRGVSGSGSRHSRVSDLELTRFERGASLSSQLPRSSMSSVRDGRPSTMSIAMGFEDDIPAFQEGGFDAYPLEATGGMLDFGDYVPPLEEEQEQAVEREADELSELRRENRASARVRAMQALREQEEEEFEEQEPLPAVAGQQPGTAAPAVAARKRKAVKRRRVVIDDRVELPARLLKQRMEDLAPIMRQRGTDALARGPLTLTAAPPAGILGLCAELQDVFSMSINALPMPFPLKEGVAAAAGAPALGTGEEERGAEVRAVTAYDEVEYTRAPRDSDLRSVTAGRLSVLQASSVGGKEGDSFTMEDEARFSHGSRGQTSYADGGDFGGFSGYDDYVPAFEAPLSFRASSPGAGGREVEESKAAGSGEARTRARQPTLIASNSISELVASTFSRTAAEQAGEGYASRTSSGQESASHHTRTEQFMDILTAEFKKQPALSFENVTSGVTKRVAAAAFLEVLQLKTWGRIDATQPAPFTDITLAPSHAGAM